MTTVIALPQSLDDQSFEQVFTQLAAIPGDARVLLDARHARWASPYGLTALLAVAQTRRERPGFVLPEADDTVSYWARTGFFKQAEPLFEFATTPPRTRAGNESHVLLEITAIGKPGDVHDVIGRIQERSQAILQGELRLDPRATMGFSMTLSEACQNIVEHAGGSGWVGVQTYKWARRLGRRVVNIAVCDAGQGFRRSLETVQQARADGRWDDAMALEDAVIRGVSRFRLKDAGRGQGLAGIRRYVGKWDGKLTVRSGTARIGIVPSWDDDKPLVEKLAPFPGAQMQITIPEPAGAAAGRAGEVCRGGTVIHHIDVHTVLQRCVCDLYSNLVTRPTGVAVRTEIEQLLTEMVGPRTLTVIDFSNVGLLDYSCADEIVAKLLLRDAARPATTEGYFLFRGINDAHADAIETVLERHGLALVAQRTGDTDVHLLGVLDAGERQAWEAMAGRGLVDSAELAAAAGCSLDDAARLLDTLARRRLVMRLDGGYVVLGGI